VSARQEAIQVARNPALTVGLLAVVLLFAIGVFGVALAPHDPNAGTKLIVQDHPGSPTVFLLPPTLPDADHWLGTDGLGRDQWSRILAGAWLTLTVVLSATIVRFGIGVSLGIPTGWYGGPFARGVTLLSSGVAAIPQLVLAIILVLVTRPLGIVGFIGSLALVGWPEIAEFLGGETRRAKVQPFMEAARAVGAPERRLIGTHLLSSLGPQLLTVLALEMGSVLLLLAELGLVGLFLSGATFLLNDFVRTGPLTSRVPEWGQMLGGIVFYAILGQLPILLPALFIVLAATAFSILGDGLRAASDPFSRHRVRPATFGVLAKGLTAFFCFSAVGFLGFNVHVSPLTMDEGRSLAAETAQVTWPNSVFVAAVARYDSPTQGFDRPDRLTYYFRNERDEVLRISYVNADRLAVEVGPYESQDELDFRTLRPLPPGLGSYAGPATTANAADGGRLRADLGAGLVRVILTWPSDRNAPTYTVTIGRTNLLTIRMFCCIDARTGGVQLPGTWAVP
jgi:peptide/nickel transport system permease protein